MTSNNIIIILGFTSTGGGTPITIPDSVLAETGDYILTELGDYILKE